MRNLARLGAIMVGAMGLSSAMAIVAVGCGGDDTVVPLDSGKDQTTPDSPVTPTEGGADVKVDVVTDGGPDVRADGGPDAMDAGRDVALPDASGLAPADFPLEVTRALCTRLAECCPTPDAGMVFDVLQCLAANEGFGGLKYLSRHEPGLRDGGAALVQFDTTSAAQCLAGARNFTCQTPSSEYQKMRDDCYGALQGTIALNGTGCTDTIHCATGRCVLPGDGGVGTCAALVGDGGACATSDDCAYRGTSNPDLFCDDDPSRFGSPTCGPRVGDGGSCNDTDFDYAACQSGVCSGAGICLPVFTLEDLSCDTYYVNVPADAGTD